MMAWLPSTSWVTATDVVQECTTFDHRGVEPDLGGQGAGDVRGLDQMPQDVLAGDVRYCSRPAA